MKKEMHVIMKKAKKQGWLISKTTHGWKWTSPTGGNVYTGTTPSDNRAMKKHVSILCRYGYDKTA